METFQWIAYGLDMLGYVIVEVEGVDKTESHHKAVKQLHEKNINFDTLEPFDKSFIGRMGWLQTNQ